MLHASAGLALEADRGTLGLQRATVAGRRHLEPLFHARRPRLDVKALHRDEAQIAGAALDNARGQLEPLEDLRREIREHE